MDEADYVFIDNISIRFLKYNQCYITKIDPTSLPANYYFTNITQKTMTITSAGTCSSQYDFGVAKNSISVSGRVYNDANGLKNNQVDGSGVGTVNGSALYAYLVNSSGKVAFKTTVNGSGDFSFPLADVNTTYNLMTSTSSVSPFSNAPASASLPGYWTSVGEEYGLFNGAGSGVKSGS